MDHTVCRLSVLLVLALLLVGAPAAYADSYQVTFSGSGVFGTPIRGSLNLTASPLGGGAFLVTGVSGVENGLAVGGLIPSNSTGLVIFPNVNGFQYDDKLFPNSDPVFDKGGLLFTLVGPHGGVIYENLYSTGASLYLESAYLNGLPYPLNFSYGPVKIGVVATPEPRDGAYVFLGALAILVTFAAKFIGRR